MDRKAAFLALAQHAWFSRVFAKLSDKARQFALDFIDNHQAESHNDFIHHVNRMFLDVPEKPAGWPLILDLLTAASIAANNTK